jgi:hypothetical protein
MSDYHQEYEKRKQERKTQRFEKLVFDSLKESDSYDKNLFQYRKVRIIMSQNPIFRNAAADQQFDMCTHVLCIAIESQTHFLNAQRVREFGAEPGVYKLSIDYGYTPPKILTLNKPKLLGHGR